MCFDDHGSKMTESHADRTYRAAITPFVLDDSLQPIRVIRPSPRRPLGTEFRTIYRACPRDVLGRCRKEHLESAQHTESPPR